MQILHKFTQYADIAQDYIMCKFLHKTVTWADPDTHKPHQWKASSSPKVIYVACIPTMFAKHNEQVN